MARILRIGSLALGVAACLLIFGALGEESDPAATASAPRVSSAEADLLPPGWTEIARPISDVLYPVQALAASTYPIAFRHRPESCWPDAALDQMPADGVLLQIIEYAPSGPNGRSLRVPRLPPRPRRFSYADATYAPFECEGPSYQFAYEQQGRALQAQVWMKRGTVDPHLRAQALRILDRFQA